MKHSKPEKIDGIPHPLAYGIEDVPPAIGLPRSTIFEEVRTGRLPSFKVGRRRNVTHWALVEYARQREQETLTAESSMYERNRLKAEHDAEPASKRRR
jgi:hypothetical protein